MQRRWSSRAPFDNSDDLITLAAGNLDGALTFPRAGYTDPGISAVSRMGAAASGRRQGRYVAGPTAARRA